MYDVVSELLNCGLLILMDACPPNPEYYICKVSEDYEETACERCWRKYLFDVANGKASNINTSAKHYKVVNLK